MRGWRATCCVALLVLACKSDAPTCHALSASDCAARDDCMQTHAALYSEAERCLAPPSFVDCLETRACGEAITYARDGAGRLWELGSTCLPDGWTSAGGSLDGGTSPAACAAR
jgi:hypothetical protein